MASVAFSLSLKKRKKRGKKKVIKYKIRRWLFFSGSALAQQGKAAQLQLWNTDFSSHKGPSETYKFRHFKSRAAPNAKSKWKRSRQSEETLGHPCQQEKFLLLSPGRVNPHKTREVSKLQSKGSSLHVPARGRCLHPSTGPARDRVLVLNANLLGRTLESITQNQQSA